MNVDGLDQTVTVTFIEWKKKKLKGTQRIYLCDGNGSALLDIPAELPARNIIFTAYVCWDDFKNQDTSAALAILGGEDMGAKVLDAGRVAIREQLKQRDLERRAEAVEDFKAEKSYPFEAEPKNAPERAIRKAFDIVATAATPVLEKMDVEQRRFSMKLMRVAVETDPSAVQKVLREVLRLPEERINVADWPGLSTITRLRPKSPRPDETCVPSSSKSGQRTSREADHEYKTRP